MDFFDFTSFSSYRPHKRYVTNATNVTLNVLTDIRASCFFKTRKSYFLGLAKLIQSDSMQSYIDSYESISNLYSNNGTIKTTIWATSEPQLISGLIGEVSFSWYDENDGGEIWLENFIINDAYASGGITLSGYDNGEISDGLNIINELLPEKLSLKQNFPNPFNPSTHIYWSMPGSGSVSIEIYNLKGQLIDVLYNGYKKLGNHEVIWNASAYSSGIYFYRLTLNETVLQKKMILLR
mgnify:CR=1 FL=1